MGKSGSKEKRYNELKYAVRNTNTTPLESPQTNTAQSSARESHAATAYTSSGLLDRKSAKQAGTLNAMKFSTARDPGIKKRGERPGIEDDFVMSSLASGDGYTS